MTPIHHPASLLYVRETSDAGGGDTPFAEMYLAYEMRAPVLQGFLEDRIAVHDGAMPYVGAYGVAPPPGEDDPRPEHALITRHPITDRRLL
ncbi:MAG: TauD/TfdA family dioxygenase [Pseudomonadota bacterium]|nr:TauD/TfdA family dioxygenase [Pseudomonadota bacterium]